MGRNMRIAAFPIIVGFLTGFGLYLMKIPDLVMPRLEFLLNAIISCATTVSGFIISSVAILIGATESQIMIKIKRNGGFPELKIRYTETLVVGLFVVAYFVFLGAAVEATNQVSRLYPICQCRSPVVIWLLCHFNWLLFAFDYWKHKYRWHFIAR